MKATDPNCRESRATVALDRLSRLLLKCPAAKRGTLLQSVLSFRATDTVEESFEVGLLRAAFAEYWEARTASAVPIRQMRDVLQRPVRIKTVLEFSKLNITRDMEDIASAVTALVDYLLRRTEELVQPTQLGLFSEPRAENGTRDHMYLESRMVTDLQQLVDDGSKFPTIYADPPWPYENTASNGAAANHYPTMTIGEICAEPVGQIASRNAHLHLWTTNSFLREAFDVIGAWGFRYKSCLVWVKPEMGTGNYWRVSHEFLLLGVRGSLRFLDRSQQSWVQAHRTVHSRKPGRVRAIIEKVSPAPYLELYGREEHPDSAWTVYGNQIERRLF